MKTKKNVPAILFIYNVSQNAIRKEAIFRSLLRALIRIFTEHLFVIGDMIIKQILTIRRLPVFGYGFLIQKTPARNSVSGRAVLSKHYDQIC